MRIIKISVVLLGFLIVVMPKISEASEISNTKNNLNLTENSIFLFHSPLLSKVKTEAIVENVAVEEPAKTDEEIQYEKMLVKWKPKQAEKWANLPTETFVVNASAYTAAADECGKSDGKTSSGIKVHKGTLACPPNFPFGAKLEIEGYGTFVCEDRGGAIKGNHIDIYMETKSEAFAFGRRNLNAKIVD